MNASSVERDTPHRSPATRSSKRKADFMPDEAGSSKKTRTRKSKDIEEGTLRGGIESREEAVTNSVKNGAPDPVKADAMGLLDVAQKTKEVKAEEESKPLKSEKPSRTTRKMVKVEVKKEEDQVKDISPGKDKRKRNKADELVVNGETKEPLATEDTPQKTKQKRRIKQEKIEEEDKDGAGEKGTIKKVKQKRKTKEEKEAEAMPLAARTTGLRMYIGAHVSSAKGRSLDCSYAVNLVLSLYRIFRRTECSHQLCPYWVIAQLPRSCFRVNVGSVATHSPCFSNLNGSGRTHRCRMSTRFYSRGTVTNTNTMLGGNQIFFFQVIVTSKTDST